VSRAGATGRLGQTTHRDLIAGEILATSFEFGEPTDGVQNRRRRRVRDCEDLVAAARGSAARGCACGHKRHAGDDRRARGDETDCEVDAFRDPSAFQ